MKKNFDPSFTYAVALGGGGAKGAYEVGVWRALEEEGMRYNAVSGTSVGALNGALMTMRELGTAEELWRRIHCSDVMDVDDSLMARIFSGDIKPAEIRPIWRRIKSLTREGGVDVTPLRNLLTEYVDEKKIRTSDVEFYAMTYSLTDKEEVEVDVKSLPVESMRDMLLASAYLPVFKNVPLGGKRYTDGGISDSLPISALLRHGHKRIIAVRLKGSMGIEKRIKPSADTVIYYIEPSRSLGSILDFSPEHSDYLLKLGYYDAKRFVYGLEGSYYYIERTMGEGEAYHALMQTIHEDLELIGKKPTLRYINEELLPRFAKEYGSSGDYYDVLIHYLEHMGAKLSVPEFSIMTDKVLTHCVRNARSSAPSSINIVPKCISRLN